MKKKFFKKKTIFLIILVIMPINFWKKFNFFLFCFTEIFKLFTNWVILYVTNIELYFTNLYVAKFYILEIQNFEHVAILWVNKSSFIGKRKFIYFLAKRLLLWIELQTFIIRNLFIYVFCTYILQHNKKLLLFFFLESPKHQWGNRIIQ